MAGHVRGTIECSINAGFSNAQTQIAWNTNWAFINIYNFFNNHSNCTMIASNYGSNAGGGHGFTGTGFSYTTTPSTTTSANAWFLTRMNATTTRPYDVYHLFQWTTTGDLVSGSIWFNGELFGTTPGNPGLISGGTLSGSGGCAIAHSCAVGIGGTGGSALSVSNGYGNPWKGTTNNNGSDTKGSTVWGVPSGGGTSFLVWPRSNAAPQGNFISLTQNMTSVMTNFAGGNSTLRQQILADDDSWVILCDTTNSGNYQLASSGIYINKSTLSSSIVPYYQFSHGFNTNITSLDYTDATTSGSAGSCYGTLAGNTNFEGGIGSYSYGQPTVRGIQFDQLQAFATDSKFFPNLQSSGGTYYDELDIAVGSQELTFAGAGYVPMPFLNGSQFGQCGYLGRIDFIRQSYNIPANAVKSDYSRYYIGSTTTQAQQKYSVPWDNVNDTVPLSGTTPQGITFISTVP